MKRHIYKNIEYKNAYHKKGFCFFGDSIAIMWSEMAFCKGTTLHWTLCGHNTIVTTILFCGQKLEIQTVENKKNKFI